MIRVLVTGGAGFIGSNFIQHLNATRPDWELVSLDAYTYAANVDNIIGPDGWMALDVVGDISREDDVARVFEEHGPFDYVVNFAAESHVDRALHSASQFIESNVRGVDVLCREMLKPNNVDRLKRFIQISTDEVYGERMDDPAYEMSPLSPRNPYAASKAGGEHIAMSYYHTFGLPVVITRSCNNYGPNQHAEKFIPTVIRSLQRGTKIPVYGSGLAVREWMHVEDHCSAILHLMRHGVFGEVYNIGTSEREANITMICMLAQMMNIDAKIDHVEDRPGHDRRYAIDSRKLRRLGWKPEYTLEAGLKVTVPHYTEEDE